MSGGWCGHCKSKLFVVDSPQIIVLLFFDLGVASKTSTYINFDGFQDIYDHTNVNYLNRSVTNTYSETNT